MATTKKNDGVATTHRDYDKMAPKWKRARDVIAGQDAMHAAGEEYLPKLIDEDSKEYGKRLKRSDFFNASWRSVDVLGGLAFRKPPAVDLPGALDTYKADINMAGMSLDSLAGESIEETLTTGRLGLLVDHPPQNVVGLNVAAAEALGLRPSIQFYPAESVINWKFGRVNNSWVLVMVVLKECEAVEDGEFAETLEDRYRVLDLVKGTDDAGNATWSYRQRLFKQEKGKDVQIGGDIFPEMAGKRLDRIPFTFVGTGGKADKIDDPPLIDLFDKNIAHYQINADYRHGLHFTGLPTLFLAGLRLGEGEKVHIGGSAAIVADDPQAKGEFIEFSGQGLEPSERALDRAEKQMAALGAYMIVGPAQTERTATEAVLDFGGDNSTLAKIVINVSNALEWALKLFAEWAGVQGGEIVYQINRDFNPMMLDPQRLTALLGYVIAGQMSKQELFATLQRGDVIDPTKTFEEHEAEIDLQGPPAPKPVPANEPGAEAA